MVFADQCAELPAMRFGDRRGGRGPDRGGIIADVVIARQVTAGDGQRVVQALGEFDIVAAGRPVERDVAGVDDEIRSINVDMFADALEVGDQVGKAPAEMGVGNLRQAKFGHGISIPVVARRNDDGAGMHRNEQNLKHAVADRIGVLRGEAAR